MVVSEKPILERMALGFGAMGLGQVVTMFIRLAEVPLLLSFWDLQLYGEWLIVSAIPAYLMMVDGGFTNVTGREMIMRVSAGERLGALVLFQSTWALLLVMSALIGLLALVTVPFMPFDTWFNLHGIDNQGLRVAIIILAFYVLVGFQTGLLYGAYSCEGQYAKGIVFSALTMLLEFGGLAIAAMTGGGIVEAALGYFAGRCVGWVIFLAGLKKAVPWLRYGTANASRLEMSRLLKPSLTSMFFPLGNALNIQGMRIVVGMILGPAAVAIFTAIRTLSRAVIQPVTILTRLIEPELAIAFGAGQHEQLRKIFVKSSQIVLWSGLSVCVVLWFAGGKVLTVWTDGKVLLQEPLFSLLLLASLANILWGNALMVPYSTNRHNRIAVFYLLVNGAAAVILAAILVPVYGLGGAAAALLAVEMVMAVIAIMIALQLSNETLVGWIKAIVQPPWFIFDKAVVRVFRK